jgi:hypothetical protein
MKLVNNLDFNKYEARNIKLQNLAAAPSSPTVGQAYYDTSLNKPRIWDGTAWKDMVGADGTVTSVSGAAPITSTGGTAPTIGITDATPSARGAMTAADKSKLDGIEAGATAPGPLDELTDVAISSPATAQVLRYNGSSWVNEGLIIGDIFNLTSMLDSKVDDSQVGAAGGVASLDAGGKVPQSQLPALALTDVSVVASIAERDALTAQEGDVAIVNGDRSYIYDGTTWQELDSATDGVQSVTAGTGITIGGTTTNPSVALSANGVTATQLNTSVAGNGLTGGGGTALAVNAGTGLEIVSDAVRIAAAAAGNGLTGGAGSALAVGAGTGISVTADAVAIDTAVVVRKSSFNVGDGTATSYVLTHNLGTRDVQVTVYTNAAPYDEVLADVEHTDTNTVTLRFANAPAANAYRATVQG